MLTAGSFWFGVVLGWATAFAGTRAAGLAYRFVASLVAASAALPFGAAAAAATLAGCLLGALAHELFIGVITSRRGAR